MKVLFLMTILNFLCHENTLCYHHSEFSLSYCSFQFSSPLWTFFVIKLLFAITTLNFLCHEITLCHNHSELSLSWYYSLPSLLWTFFVIKLLFAMTTLNFLSHEITLCHHYSELSLSWNYSLLSPLWIFFVVKFLFSSPLWTFLVMKLLFAMTTLNFLCHENLQDLLQEGWRLLKIQFEKICFDKKTLWKNILWTSSICWWWNGKGECLHFTSTTASYNRPAPDLINVPFLLLLIASSSDWYFITAPSNSDKCKICQVHYPPITFPFLFPSSIKGICIYVPTK